MAQAGTTTNFSGVDSSGGFYVDGTQVIDENGNVDAPITTSNLSFSGTFIPTGTETIAAAGTTTALDLTKYHHDIDADAGGDIFTLADGTQGQETVIVLKTATGVATITPATFHGGTSVTIAAAGAAVQLRFQTTLGWAVIGENGSTTI